jgi:multidrug resistance protein MdtO
MAASLRFALTSALATLLLLILQPPVGFIAPALFMLVLVSHDTPYRCFRDLHTLLSAGALGITAVLRLVAATGDHPVARVVGLAVFTFLAAFFFRTSVMPAFPMGFGCLTFMVISLWEYQIRAEKILHISLRPMGVLATVAGSAVVVEYLFNRSDPLVALRREIKARCAALERLFQSYATHVDGERIEKQSTIVRRYAATGVGQLQVLLERVCVPESRRGDGFPSCQRGDFVSWGMVRCQPVFRVYRSANCVCL